MEQDAAVACSIAASAAMIYFYHRQQVRMGRGGIKLLQAFLMLVDEKFGTYLAPFPPTDGQAVGPGAAAADGQQNIAAPAVDGNVKDENRDFYSFHKLKMSDCPNKTTIQNSNNLLQSIRLSIHVILLLSMICMTIKGQLYLPFPTERNGTMTGDEKKRKSRRSKRSKREKKTEDNKATDKDPEAKVAA
uniref:Uncharacterized protein n=1 Tax=Romanomermis culicivorax TaxID=13658 RepID=A0A915IJR4_ROMCU